MKLPVVFLLLAGCAHAQVEIGSRSSTSSAQVHASGGAAVVLGVAMALSDPYRPEAPPELDPTRKVNEQDCSKPVDWSRGNLRCK